MLEYSRWKYLLLVVLLAFSVLYSLPNLFPQQPAVQVTANRGAQVDAALEQKVTAALRQAGVPFQSVAIGKDGNLLVRSPNNDAQIRAPIAWSQAGTVEAWLRATT